MLVRLGASGLAVMTDMPGYAKGRPNEGSGTKNEDKKQNSHRGEDNKRTVGAAEGGRSAAPNVEWVGCAAACSIGLDEEAAQFG